MSELVTKPAISQWQPLRFEGELVRRPVPHFQLPLLHAHPAQSVAWPSVGLLAYSALGRGF